MIELTLIWLFPVAITLSLIAMSAGVGGAILFGPFFFLILKLPPDVSLGAALLLEIFGLSTGIISFAREKMIDFWLARLMICFTVPAVFLGIIIKSYLDPGFLIIAFGFAMILASLPFITKNRKILIKHPHYHEVLTKKGKERYQLPKRLWEFFLLTALGGFLVGVLSAGLGEVNEVQFLNKLKMHSALAAGTSIFVVAITAFLGSIIHLFSYLSHPEQLLPLLSIILFTIPGVIIGAQLGVKLTEYIQEKQKRLFLFILFSGVGLLSLGKAFL